eukprot:COSAG03_NODE_306_length_9154_cov_7.381999_6_plen_123_part_00
MIIATMQSDDLEHCSVFVLEFSTAFAADQPPLVLAHRSRYHSLGCARLGLRPVAHSSQRAARQLLHGTFSQTYGSILTVILHSNGVPCCWNLQVCDNDIATEGLQGGATCAASGGVKGAGGH